jgi:TfoX/Sxy family transcriptional regulator of competence genes
MAYDEGLAQRIRELLSNTPGLVEKKMFGGIGFLLDGNMACGVHGDSMIVRVAPEDHEAALRKPHASVFDLTGRPMRGWVVVAREGVEEAEYLRDWVEQGTAFARTLPPK